MHQYFFNKQFILNEGNNLHRPLALGTQSDPARSENSRWPEDFWAGKCVTVNSSPSSQNS
jgi:hypothetical protein